MLAALLLRGTGLGVLTPAVVAAGVSAVPSDRAALASAVNNTARQAGGAAVDRDRAARAEEAGAVLALGAPDHDVEEVRMSVHSPSTFRRVFEAIRKLQTLLPDCVLLSSGSRVRLPVRVTRLKLLPGHLVLLVVVGEVPGRSEKARGG